MSVNARYNHFDTIGITEMWLYDEIRDDEIDPPGHTRVFVNSVPPITEEGALFQISHSIPQHVILHHPPPPRYLMLD